MKVAAQPGHLYFGTSWSPDGAWVLTALDGGKAKLAELGVPYGGD